MVAFHAPDEPFVIKESSNLKDALNRLKKTNGLPLVVVDKHLALIGILSSGDIARYLEKQNVVNIDYFVFGHRHLPLEITIDEKTKYINLGDWIQHNSYAVFDEGELTLQYFK